METIRSKNPQIRRKAVLSENVPLIFHVTFFINEEQLSLCKPSRMYRTEAGAIKAANNWVENGK